MVYNILMKHNETNTILENVLTKEEIDQLYAVIERPFQQRLMKLFVQSISDFDLPNNIAQKIINYCELISGEPGLEISEYQFARYKKTIDPDSGEMLLPKLTPHWDASFEEPRFTFDYQIGGNTMWPIVVENKEFTLKNNSAVTFSGTHQIHWRKPKVFNDNEYIDMIFFHLRKVNSSRYDDSLPDIMIKKEKDFIKQYEQELL